MIEENQLGRRNLSDDQRAMVAEERRSKPVNYRTSLEKP
jgi:hypothetical protein